MSGYRAFETGRTVLRSGPPPTPIVSRALVTPRSDPSRLVREAEEAPQRKVQEEAERKARELDDLAGRIRLAIAQVDDATNANTIVATLGTTRLKAMLALAAAVSGVGVDEIICRGRTAGVLKARQLYFWLGRVYARRSYPEIASLCGNRDHTCALLAFRRVSAVVSDLPGIDLTDPPLAAQALWNADWPTGAARRDRETAR